MDLSLNVTIKLEQALVCLSAVDKIDLISCKHLCWSSSWARILNVQDIIKGVVNCQNTRDNVVPRMQQWPLDIPQ